MTAVCCEDAVARFWAKVDKRAEQECWPWKGAKNTRGYGYFSAHSRAPCVGAHRIAYSLCVKAIPDGLTIDHLCRNKGCVNPAHLEPVSMKENLMRGTSFSAKNAAKLMCLRGHPFTTATIRKAGQRSWMVRRCLACARYRYAKRKAQK